MISIPMRMSANPTVPMSLASRSAVPMNFSTAINQQVALSDEAKQALLNCFAHVAWIDENGQDYYDALQSALYAVQPATLVSISAVYTQSGSVYPIDTLDSLKNNLVVTATYDDSSTSEVVSYTLSGTLEVGTSTITVSYEGKTTTFNVTVTAILHPFENGSHTFTNPPGTLEVTNGNTASITKSSTTNKDIHVNISNVSNNSAAINDTSNYMNNNQVYFTLHTGDVVEFKATVNALSNYTSSQKYSWLMRKSTGTSITFVNNQSLDSLVVGNTYTVTYTSDADYDIMSIGVWMGSYGSMLATNLNITVSLFVNGVKYV